jgi:hypothetical protein
LTYYCIFSVKHSIIVLIIISLLYDLSGLKTSLYKHIFFFRSEKFIPTPHLYTTSSLKSNIELVNVIADINRLLPQLSGFISQFNNIVNENAVNVITDTAGNMSIDVPNNMPDSVVVNINNRIGIIDRLISNHGANLNNLFQKGQAIEQTLKIGDPNYVSKLSEQVKIFTELKASYKH